MRRFVEVGVPGYHINDPAPKCGHQGGKVLVPSDEQIKRLNAAASSSTSCGCPASSSHAPTEAANSRADERDQPFATQRDQARRTVLQVISLAMVRRFTN